MEYIADTFYQDETKPTTLDPINQMTKSLVESLTTELHQMRKGLSDLKNIFEIAKMEGTVDYDPYFLGMYNALACAMSCFTGNEPEFMEAPKEWICEYAINESDSLDERIAKVCKEYYHNRVGDNLPTNIEIHFNPSDIQVVKLAETYEPNTNTTMLPDFPVGSDCVYDNPDAVCLDYVGYEG